MKTKCFEIRDSMTFIPVCAIDTSAENSAQSYLLRRYGYSSYTTSHGSTVIVVNLNDCRASNSPYEWGNSRTMSVAHEYIERAWAKLSDGDVIDVEFLLGETTECKLSERHSDR